MEYKYLVQQRRRRPESGGRVRGGVEEEEGDEWEALGEPEEQFDMLRNMIPGDEGTARVVTLCVRRSGCSESPWPEQEQ